MLVSSTFHVTTAETDRRVELMQASRKGDATARRSLPLDQQSRQPATRQTSLSPPTSTGEIAERYVLDLAAARPKTQNAAAIRELERGYSRKDLEGQQTRRWRAGDVYAPHDLSGVEASKWKKVKRRPRPRAGERDVLDQLGINPIKEYKNFSMMAEYVTEMGRIKGGVDTGLRPVNQRRMAKAIRRAIGTGLMPSVYKHPELLKLEMERRIDWR